MRGEFFLRARLPMRPCPVHAGAGGGEAARGADGVDGFGGRLEDLALELFLGEGPGPKILFPRDGAVFYLDPARGPSGGEQEIQAWIAARREEVLEVRLNGRVCPLRYPFLMELPVNPGIYRLEVAGPSGSDAASYQVR